MSLSPSGPTQLFALQLCQQNCLESCEAQPFRLEAARRCRSHMLLTKQTSRRLETSELPWHIWTTGMTCFHSWKLIYDHASKLPHLQSCTMDQMMKNFLHLTTAAAPASHAVCRCLRSTGRLCSGWQLASPSSPLWQWPSTQHVPGW